MRRRRWVRRLGSVLLLLGGWVFLWHVALPPLYDFPPPAPFRGPHWYNPYRHFSSPPLRVNLHAHAELGLGLPRKMASVEAVRERYRRLGYDVIGISDYQYIRPPGRGPEVYVPVYEHGFGVRPWHQLVVGARRVLWLDFPFYQGARQKQYLLDLLGRDAALVVLNHPNLRGALSLAEAAALTGFAGIEVASRYARGVRHWDAALSAGRRAWGFANDDAHDIRRRGHTDVAWMWVGARARSAAAVLEALKRGAFYAVWAKERQREEIRLEEVRLAGGTVWVRFRAPVARVRFIGQGGVVRKEARRTREAAYRLREEDTYLRVEAEGRLTTVFLNPLFRYSRDPFTGPKARVREPATTLLRGGGALLAAILLLLAVRSFRREP